MFHDDDEDTSGIWLGCLLTSLLVLLIVVILLSVV